MNFDNPDQFLVQLSESLQEGLADNPLLAKSVGVLLAVVPLVTVFALCFAFTTWLERKGLARIQNRLGPNRVGPYGLFQPIADGIKMLTKEDIVPRSSDHFFHLIAPLVVVGSSMAALAFIPFGLNMTLAPIDSAVVFFFAILGMNTLAVFLAGWASRNKYSLLGGMRAVAQMVSYEIPLVLSAVTVVMMVGSLDTTQIVGAQRIDSWVASDNAGLSFLGQIAGWHVFTPWGFVGFIIFFIAALAETNRSPFDLPEAESEIIAGYLTEYSGFKFALFFLGEYVGAFAVLGLAITLFLGGWNAPNMQPWWSSDPQALLIPGFIWFFIKMFLLMGVLIWIRGTLPRLRVDQLMSFAWKFLLPLALVNVLVAGVLYHAPSDFRWLAGGIAFVFLYLVAKGLARMNRTTSLSKRTYRFAE
ncbi:MAG: NADH-quinone oxidoreductase subunit NuoH [Opitutales bacterium]